MKSNGNEGKCENDAIQLKMRHDEIHKIAHNAIEHMNSVDIDRSTKLGEQLSCVFAQIEWLLVFWTVIDK